MSETSTPDRSAGTTSQPQPAPTADLPTAPGEDELRRVAIGRLKKKRDFRSHLFVYTVINIAIWAGWVIDGVINGFEFPWPIFVTVFWGLFVLGQANDLYRRDPLREDLVQHEIEELRAAARLHPLDTYDLTDKDDWC